MSFSFTNVGIIGSVTPIFIMYLIFFGNCSLKQIAFRILLGDLNTTVNLTFSWHDRNMSVNCFLPCKDNFLKILKIWSLPFSQMMTLGDDVLKMSC